MKLFISMLLFTGSFSCAHPPADEGYETFSLHYSYAGLGSGMGSMQPTFKITGKDYVYTYQQNSYYGQPDKQPDTLSTGRLRSASIDSILHLVNQTRDTLVYRSGRILSGGLHVIAVSHNDKRILFELHNAFDSTAEKIVNILNSNIPAGIEKLWIFGKPTDQ